MLSKGQAYITEVLEQIKSKEAKKYVSAELAYHLKETRRAFMKDGLTEEEADEKATAQMGSPTKLGMKLNRIHRPRVDWFMLTILFVTLIFSYLPMLTIPAVMNGGIIVGNYYIVNKAIIIFLGMGVVISLMFFDYRKLRNLQWVFFGLAIVVLLLPAFMPTSYMLGVPRFKISQVTNQLTIESSMVLPFLYLFWAAFLKNKHVKLWQAGLIFTVSFFLLQFLGSPTTLLIYVSMVISMVVWRLRKAAGPLIGIVVFVSLLGIVQLFSTRGYWLERVVAFIHPERNKDNMYEQVKELMNNAGLFGNAAKIDFLPEPHTDFVFVNFTYHYGWVLAGLLVLLLALLLVRMVMTLGKITDPFGSILIIGGAVIFSVQFIFNIAMTIGLLPMTAMPLPFISYGLMPTLLNSLIVGLFLSIYRRKDIVLKEEYGNTSL